MAELLSEAGLPNGVFNVVQGDKSAVDALLTHPDVRAVSFVGSTPIAQVDQSEYRQLRVHTRAQCRLHASLPLFADQHWANRARIGHWLAVEGLRCNTAILYAFRVAQVGGHIWHRFEHDCRVGREAALLVTRRLDASGIDRPLINVGLATTQMQHPRIAERDHVLQEKARILDGKTCLRGGKCRGRLWILHRGVQVGWAQLPREAITVARSGILQRTTDKCATGWT